MTSNEVIIIDYGISNILSVQHGFEEIGVNAIITSDPSTIEQAGHLVLPGVGAFAKAMSALENLNLINSITKAVKNGVPFLGICLGMQMLMDESDEFGVTKGLGFIPGRVEEISRGKQGNEKIKVPQINWHELKPSKSGLSWEKSLLHNHSMSDAVYFVHSFTARPTNDNHVLADYIYLDNRISAVIVKDNIMGCQFHPEKSGKVGLEILKNFMSLQSKN